MFSYHSEIPATTSFYADGALCREVSGVVPLPIGSRVNIHSDPIGDNSTPYVVESIESDFRLDFEGASSLEVSVNMVKYVAPVVPFAPFTVIEGCAFES